MAFVVKRTRPSDIKQLLAERAIQPRRMLGQNFLIDENIRNIILDSAHIAGDDKVLEIGPGLGVLTEQLLVRAGQLIAVEKDPQLATYLQETFGSHPSLTLITADALALGLPNLLASEQITHVVSNLPYSSGTRMLVDMIDAPARPLRMVVMLQLDVAERFVARPGTKAYGIVALHAQLHYDVLLRKTVSPTCFYPPPDVQSAIVEWYRLPHPRVRISNETHFRACIKWCFSQRRKQMGHILQRAPLNIVPNRDRILAGLADLSIDASRRPESLCLNEWGAVSNWLVAPNPERIA